jgi:DNA-binding FadR family transcriptional regulator
MEAVLSRQADRAGQAMNDHIVASWHRRRPDRSMLNKAAGDAG